MNQNGAEMRRDAPRWAEMGRDAPRCAEMCPTARCALETTSASQMLILSSCHAPAGGSERARVGFAPAARLLGVSLGRLVPRTRRELVEQADLERDSGHHP